MAQYDGSIRINTKITTKEASAQLMTLENRIVKTADKIASLRSKMDALKDSKIPTTEYREVSTQISRAELEFNKLLEKQERMQREGKDSGVAWERLNEKMEEVGNTIRYAQGELQSLVDTGKAFTPGSDTEEFAKLGQQLQYAENDMAVLNKRHDELTSKQGKSSAGYKKLGETAKKSFEKINKSAKKSGSLLSTLASRFKGLALSLLIFNQISKAFNAMMSGIREGIGNLARYSTPVNAALSSMKSALTQLKNSLATAFAPILTTVAPILTSFINMLSRAATYVGMLIAALTGQKMFTKATAVQEQYADALGDTASNAKDANKQLSSLDKLNNLSSNSGGGGGGGGGGSGLSPGDMFETVPIENEIISFAEKIKKIFGDMFAPLKAAWAEYGDSIKSTLSKIWQNFVDFGVRIGQSTYEWFKNLNWEPLLSSIDNLLKNLEPLIDLILDGLAWAYENVLLPFGKWTIEEAIPVVLDLISAALGALNEVLIALEPLGTWLWENFLQPLGEWAGDVIIGALETITDLLEKFGDWVSEHQEAIGAFFTVIAPVAGILLLIANAGTILAGVMGLIGGAIALLTSPVTLIIAAIAALAAGFIYAYEHSEKFRDAVNAVIDWSKQLIPGIIEGIKSGWESLTRFLSDVWKSMVDGFKDFFGIHSPSTVMAEFGKYLMEGLLNGIKGLISSFKGVWNGIKDIVSGAMNGISTVISSVIGAIRFLWDSVWRGMANTVNNIWNGIVGTIVSAIQTIVGWISDLFSIFNQFTGKASVASGAVGSAVSGALPKKASRMSIYPELAGWTPAPIPKLAAGTVVPPNREFMAVLGDNKREAEIVSPLSTMKQASKEAVLEVLSELGLSGGNRSNQGDLVINIDGREVFRVTQDYAKDYFRRTGLSPYPI